ncbi:unnamed protein product, partial [marine sediment metagenome]
NPVYKGFASIDDSGIGIALTKFGFELGALVAQAKLIKKV